MVGSPQTGKGVQLQRGDGSSPENFVTVAGLKDFNWSGMVRDMHETTDQSSGQAKTFVGGNFDPGEWTFTLNWLPRDPSQGQEEGGLLAEFLESSCGSLRNWRVLIPDCDAETILDSAGVFQSADIAVPLDDIMTMQGGIKLSGEPHVSIETA